MRQVWVGLALFVLGVVGIAWGIVVLVAPAYDASATQEVARRAADTGFLLAGAGLVLMVLAAILVKNARR